MLSTKDALGKVLNYMRFIVPSAPAGVATDGRVAWLVFYYVVISCESFLRKVLEVMACKK